MALTLVTPPVGDLLTKSELLNWVRADDILANANEVMRLIQAAESSFREYTGRVLRESTWTWTRSRFSSQPFRIPWVPVRSVEEISYLDQAGDEQIIDPDDYQAEPDDQDFTYLTPAPNGSWPVVESGRLGGVTITFKAGMYATTPTVERPDEEILTRLKVYVHKFFNQRGANVKYGLDAIDDDWLVDLWAPWHNGELI